MTGTRVIRISDATWRRLQDYATAFRGSELGTPDKVIARLLDEVDPPRAWGGASPPGKMIRDAEEARMSRGV